MGPLLQDLRFAARSLRKHPGFALVIVLTLALGIGADTAIFSVVNASLLRPLPYGDPDRLVSVQARRGVDELGVSWLDYLDWKTRSRSLEDLAYFQEARIHLGFADGAASAGAVMTTRNLFSLLFGLAPILPATRVNLVSTLKEGGRQAPEEAQLNPKANLQRITPGYFQAMGIPLLQGRAFANTTEDATKHEGAPRSIIVNRSLAERLWPGRDPLGQRIEIGRDPSRRNMWTVVGVVGDVRHQGLDRDAGLDLYVPFFQFPSYDALTFVVRGRGESGALAAAARAEIRAVSADLLVKTAAPLDRLLAQALWQPRLWGALFGAFSAVALLLAAVGIYGVMSFLVGQRTREIGLRMALGAGRAAVARLLLGQGLRLTLAGIAAGLVGAVLLGRFLSGLLYQVEPTDPPTWLAISLLLTAVALLATWIPTRRAMGIDPMVALRRE